MMGWFYELSGLCYGVFDGLLGYIGGRIGWKINYVVEQSIKPHNTNLENITKNLMVGSRHCPCTLGRGLIAYFILP